MEENEYAQNISNPKNMYQRISKEPAFNSAAITGRGVLSSSQVLKGRPLMPLDCALFTPGDAKVAFS